MSNLDIVNKYTENKLLESICIAGLEPFLQFEEVYNFISEFRKTNNDDVVIFTGYYPNEIESEIDKLKEFENIYLKVGRFIANSESVYDEVLGITLASSNQYGIKIS